MSFAEHLATFRAKHPDTEVAEVYISDLNGVARGKLVPADMLEKMAGGGMKLPVSTLGLDIFGNDVAESGNALEIGDPDGNLIPIDATLAPMLWAGRPTAQSGPVQWAIARSWRWSWSFTWSTRKNRCRRSIRWRAGGSTGRRSTTWR
jgi:hypothetical protein